MENKLRKMAEEEFKQCLLNILIYFDQFCQQNGLRYWIAAGTLIGAVRHHGFIPWDDDIDVYMPRPDYDKMYSLLEEGEPYRAVGPKENGYYYPFIKLSNSGTALIEKGHHPVEGLGVSIDVFPLEGMPSPFDEAKRHLKAITQVRRVIFSYSTGAPKIRKNLYIYARQWMYHIKNKLSSLEAEQKKYYELVMRYPYDSCEYVYPSGGRYKEREILRRDLFSQTVPLEFEGHTFCAPGQWDAILGQIYGNYMQPPPEKERITHHVFDPYWKV